MRGPYVSFTGMYFKVGGSAHEQQLNVEAAARIVYRYITEGGHWSEVREALDFLQAHDSKLKPYCETLRGWLFIDDLFDDREKQKLAGDRG